jgi:hypothetical protein
LKNDFGQLGPQKARTSLFECIQKSKGDKKKFEVFLDSYVKELVDFVKIPFSDICDSENAAKMYSGSASGVTCRCNGRILEDYFN